MLPFSEIQFPALMLYAETHFRFFRFFPSILYKKEPEVLFDVPHRISPGADLPVLLLINDLDRFNTEPVEVAVTVSVPRGATVIHRFKPDNKFEMDHPMKFRQRAFIFPLPGANLPEGQLFINATVTLQSGRRRWLVFNDNLNTTSKRAFGCFRSPTPLPGNVWSSYGDLHVHTQFSQSHVEFGPPLPVIDKMATSSGLSFIGITDHSYDLCCKTTDYLAEDPDIEPWTLQKALLSNNGMFDTIMLPGEEISCTNAAGTTVHLGALGLTDYIPGSRDGARKNHIFTRQLTIKEAVEEIHRQGAFAFAAHPCSTSGIMQRLFLSRGAWSSSDVRLEIDALQAFNNGFTVSWQKAKRLWLNMLHEGRRIPLIAGNDAHGDFGRYRAIKLPFLSIGEDFQRYMGFGKTGIYGQCTTRDQVLAALRNGSSFITTGPYLSINFSADPASHAISMHPLNNTPETLYLHCVSTAEFGRIRKLTFIAGAAGRDESVIFSTIPSTTTYELTVPVNLPASTSGPEYYRAEAETCLADGTICTAVTNCCFSA